MSGNYTDPPGPRMAYDRDGTIGFVYNLTTGLVFSVPAGGSELQQVNDEDTGSFQVSSWDTGGSGSHDRWFGLIFPQLRDLIAYFFEGSINGGGAWKAIETSADSTNGIDGTWTERVALLTTGGAPPAYRTTQALSVSGVKAIRFKADATGSSTGGGTIIGELHLYGDIASGQTPDRLDLWDPSSDVVLPAANLDWGNAARGTVADKTFRVKNRSATLTANTITIDAEALTDTSPSVPAQFTFSTDGVTFGSTASIASLAPSAISGTVTVRRTTPSNATLSVWAARITAVAVSWS